MKLEDYHGKRICVAVSGGIDSMTLLAYLKEREEEYGYSLCALTCEHGIRGRASKKDAQFVGKECKKLRVPLFFFSEDCIERAKVEKESLETAARNFRLESYQTVLDNNTADYIATAHHVEDQAETVLFRLARGTSVTGVKGMQEEDGRFLRPFLCWTKQEIKAYAKEHKIPHREDKTNRKTDATRNKLRKLVLPNLEEAVPCASKNLARFSSLAAEDDECLYRLAKEYVKIENDTAVLTVTQEKPLFYRATLLALKALGIEKDYTFKHLDEVEKLSELQTGKKVNLPKGIVATREYGKILLSKEETPCEYPEFPLSVGTFAWGKALLQISDKPLENALCFDAETVEGCVVRSAREKDVFTKFGGGTKSLKKYLTDKKISANKRKELPVLVWKDSPFVAVVFGVEISDGVKITAKTKKKYYARLDGVEITKE